MPAHLKNMPAHLIDSSCHPFLYSYTLVVSNLLPYDERALVCDIETREEYSVLTGRKINCIRKDNTLIVSKDLFEKIKSEKEFQHQTLNN